MLIPADSEMIVSWDAVADADNGGSAITGYTATAIEGANTFTCGSNAGTCLLAGLANDAPYSVTVVATNSEGNGPASKAIIAMPRAAPVNTPPAAQTVPADFAPVGFTTPGGSFRLLFVTTQTITATSPNIDTYNAFVQTSAASSDDSNIQDFSDQFRALISTEAVDARDNTATNHTNTNSDGTSRTPDTDAPIYWLGGVKAADDYDDFYDGGWDSVVGRDQNGNTTTPNLIIWTGSKSDGTVGIDFRDNVSKTGAGSFVGINPTTNIGSLVINNELEHQTTHASDSRGVLPLYALSPILILNQVPTVSTTVIPDQNAPIGATFDYTFPDFTDADNDTITYSAEIPNAAWLNFDPTSRTFSGMPTVGDVGFVTVTVTASDGIDEVTTEFSVAVAMLSLSGPPEPQTVSANYTFAPSPVPADRKFRLLFVTTQTTAATSADIDTYNAFVQTSAAVGHSDIRGFNSEFRALISTESVDARVNTATNLDPDSDPPGTDTDAPIYWLGSDNQVATGYGDFYDGGWISQDEAGRDQNGDTYTFANPMRPTIWTGSEDDGQGAVDDSESRVAGASGGAVRIGQLEASKEISGLHNSFSFNSVFTLNPLYALSPILILNQIPTVSTFIPDQTAPIGGAFTYTFSDTTFVDADSDTITYSAEIPDAAWLTFNPVTRTFSGTPTAADVGFITVTRDRLRRYGLGHRRVQRGSRYAILLGAAA